MQQVPTLEWFGEACDQVQVEAYHLLRISLKGYQMVFTEDVAICSAEKTVSVHLGMVCSAEKTVSVDLGMI